MMPVEGSWKGKIWSLIILWPIFGIPLSRDFFEYEGDYAWLKQTGIVIGWLIFIIGVVKAVIMIRNTFREK